jgi:acetyl-CoA carboxylase biotin carboxylase subunit
VDTSRDFHLRVMEDDEFRAGAIEIQWRERRLASLAATKAPADSVVRAALAAALLAERDRNTRRASPSGAPARTVGPAAGGWVEIARREALR